MNEKNSIVYLNKPIESSNEDAIDVSTYVERLDSAIDCGAKMIGVISPFGAGKSSVISLLQHKHAEKSEHEKEQFVKISMWSNITDEGNKKEGTHSFHKSFLYQIASQIDFKTGTYVSRRLSRNYGLLKLSLKDRKSSIVAVVFVLLLSITLFSNSLGMLFPQINGTIDIVKFTSAVGAFIILIILLIKADIVFSSNKSEGNLNIDDNEIMDLYRSTILSERRPCVRRRTKPQNSDYKKKYIIVVEDLDRSNDSKVVINFLKEIRKYYLSDELKSKYKNDLTFIITVKPESLLKGNTNIDINSEQNSESLYAKLFDYTVNLQTINIDNYEAVLSGLLNEKEDQIRELKIVNPNVPIMKIPGMQWIIRERKLGIREMKERLNIAFTIYESLNKKFGEKNVIIFEKCAVVAYLTTAFEDDFYKTDDRAFEKMIENYLKFGIDADYDEIMPNVSEEYRSIVVELIDAKLIDNTYRTYFYNFPKNSYLYTSDESQIINAILYEEQIDNIEEVARRVEQTGSDIIYKSIDKINDLKLSLPDIVFENETLYNNALSNFPTKVMEYMSKMDYSEEASLQTIMKIKEILNFDKERKILSISNIYEYCKCWNEHFKESEILKLRKMLCENYAWEISKYELLFNNPHKVITKDELQLVEFLDAIKLTNIEHPEFDVDNIDNLFKIFTKLDKEKKTKYSDAFKEFLVSSKEKIGVTILAPYLIDYMLEIHQIIPSLEEDVVDVILFEDNEENEDE